MLVAVEVIHLPMLSLLQEAPHVQELVVNRHPQLTSRSALSSRIHAHQFLNFGVLGEIQDNNEGIFRWSFALHSQLRAEDTISISSPVFANQFGDRVYARLYINSDGSRYHVNSVSIFLIMVARSKASMNYHITVVLHDGYFSLVPMDPGTAFSLGHDDNIIQAVYGCQNFVSVAELIQYTTGDTANLGIQFLE